jgi:hypothetical protein
MELVRGVVVTLGGDERRANVIYYVPIVDEKRTSSTEVVWIPYTVRAIYDDPQGKFPIHVDESVIVDYESFIPWASKNVRNIMTFSSSYYTESTGFGLCFPNANRITMLCGYDNCC